MPPTIDPSLPTRKHVFRDVHSLGVGKWRTKIDAALASEKLALVPTLVEGAELPSVSKLPAPCVRCSRPGTYEWSAKAAGKTTPAA
ncbi:MAG TPA: hypothetical protein DHV85_05930 [Candidatus Accumulibacter sp.]|nr:hypothetical protein [Accumulibacter sp.]